MIEVKLLTDYDLNKNYLSIEDKELYLKVISLTRGGFLLEVYDIDNLLIFSTRITEGINKLEDFNLLGLNNYIILVEKNGTALTLYFATKQELLE
jgi:hypothetical protein